MEDFLSVNADIRAKDLIRKEFSVSERTFFLLQAVEYITCKLGKYATMNHLCALRATPSPTVYDMVNTLLGLGLLTQARKKVPGTFEKGNAGTIGQWLVLSPSGKKVIERYHEYYASFYTLSAKVLEKDDIRIKGKRLNFSVDYQQYGIRP